MTVEPGFVIQNANQNKTRHGERVYVYNHAGSEVARRVWFNVTFCQAITTPLHDSF